MNARRCTAHSLAMTAFGEAASRGSPETTSRSRQRSTRLLVRSAKEGDLVNKLRDGDIRVLTSCDIISEGFDAPAVWGAILLRPTQSLALFRQQVGRCLRPKPDGSPAIIADHVDNVSRHGLPDSDHEWSLDATKRTRADRRQQEVARCRKCLVRDEVFLTGAGPDMCSTPEVQGCVFRPRIMAERDGELEDVGSAPWAHGLDIRNAKGWRWYQLTYDAAQTWTFRNDAGGPSPDRLPITHRTDVMDDAIFRLARGLSRPCALRSGPPRSSWSADTCPCTSSVHVPRRSCCSRR